MGHPVKKSPEELPHGPASRLHPAEYLVEDVAPRLGVVLSRPPVLGGKLRSLRLYDLPHTVLLDLFWDKIQDNIWNLSFDFRYLLHGQLVTVTPVTVTKYRANFPIYSKIQLVIVTQYKPVAYNGAFWSFPRVSL